MTWKSRSVLAAILLFAIVLAWTALARAFSPGGNTGKSRFDAIVVLGSPADNEGNPTPEQLSRVTEGVHEYERGVAARLILTGGPAHNRFVEAEVMARVAESQGVPASALVIEPGALNTIQNACYSVRLMNTHGWRSAEVVSSAYHLPRAGLIFKRLPVEWRLHAAPGLEAGQDSHDGAHAALEYVKTAYYLLYSRWAGGCSP